MICFNINVILFFVNIFLYDYLFYIFKLMYLMIIDLYVEMSIISLKNIEVCGMKYDKLYYILFFIFILFIVCFFVFCNYIMKISFNCRLNYLFLDIIDS